MLYLCHLRTQYNNIYFFVLKGFFHTANIKKFQQKTNNNFFKQ